MINPSKHPTTPFQTGDDIFKEIIDRYLKSIGIVDSESHSTKIHREMVGNKFPLFIIQKGQISEILDTMMSIVQENSELREKIENLKSEIDNS